MFYVLFFVTDYYKGVLFVDPLCYFCFNVVFIIILHCLFLAALSSPAGKWLTS